MSKNQVIKHQEIFLNGKRTNNEPIHISLYNGIDIEGEIVGFDMFSILVESGNSQKLIYKHAIVSMS
jgi:host factor-I protein